MMVVILMMATLTVIVMMPSRLVSFMLIREELILVIDFGCILISIS